MSAFKTQAAIFSATTALMLAALPLSSSALSYQEIVGVQGGRVLAESAAAPVFSSGSLVNDGGTVYLISGNTKIPFANSQAFAGLGYFWNNVVRGNLSAYVQSHSYFINSANMAHPWGSWVLFGRTIYYVHESGLIGVPSWQIFLNNGGKLRYLVRANKYDLAILRANPSLPPLTMNDSRVYASAGGSSSGNIIISTNDSLNLTQGAYGNIAFTARNNPPLLAFAATAYSFSETGGVPGMVFQGYPCNRPGADVCAQIFSSDTVYLNGVPTTPGSYPVTITAKDNSGSSASQDFTVTVSSIGSHNGITVTSPAGGQRWPIGSTQTVSWDASSSIANVNIDINWYIACLYGNPRCMIAQPAPYRVASNIANSGSFSWRIASSTDDRSINPAQYTLTVSDAGTSGLSGTSNVFSIVSSATVVSLSSLAPATGPVDALVTVSGSGFTSDITQINFDVGATPATYVDSGHLTFTVPAGVGAGNCKPPMMCPMFYKQIQPGSYSISVSNDAGTSNSLSFAVTGSASATAPSINQLTPTSGPIGTQIAIKGSGFTASGNSVKFGGSYANNLSSADGMTLSFTAPISSFPCGPAQVPCPMATGILITPGAYDVSVINANGASSAKTFTVTAN